MKLIYLKTALVLGMTVMLPSVALAKKCKSSDIVCKSQKEAKKQEEAAKQEAAAAERLAKDEAAEAERAAEQAERDAEQATLEAEQLAAASLQLLQSQLTASLYELYGELREVGLDQLANVNAITDPDMWLREVVNIIMKDLAGESIMDSTLETANYLADQIGTPSDEHPFGNGPVGKQIHSEVKKAYEKALTNTASEGEKAIDYLNPAKHKLFPTAEDENVARDMIGFPILPLFMDFKYATTLQVKPIEITADVDKRIPVVLKGNVSANFPIVWGDLKEVSSAYANLTENNRFKFQIAVAFGVSSKKAYEAEDGRKAGAEGSLAFDVECSTVDIGKCQLSKISTRKKIELKRKSDNTSFYNKVSKTLHNAGLILPLLHQLNMINSNQKLELTNVLDHLIDNVAAPFKFVDQLDGAIFVPEGTGTKALDRQADMQSMAFLFAIMHAIDPQKYEKQTSVLGKDAKRTISIDDVESVDITDSMEWINADVVEGKFKSGWKFNDTYVIPDKSGYTITKKIGTEAKIEFGNVDKKDAGGKVTEKANESKIGMGGSLMSSATVGISFPTRTKIMKFIKDNRPSNIDDSVRRNKYEQLESEANFADDIGLGASRFWSTVPDERMERLMDRSDNLTLPAFLAIIH